MIKNKNINLNFFFSGLKMYRNIYEAGSMINLSSDKHLRLVARSIGRRILTICFLNTKETNRIRLIHNFAVHILKFYRCHGELCTTKYLKACQLAIQKKIAGQPFSSLREIEPDLPLPRLSKSGLPAIIKLADRASIVNGSLTVIRFYLSLFSIYRIFKIKCKAKINTITDPFTGDQEKLNDFNKFLELYTPRLITNFSISFDILDLAPKRLLPLWKSSPVSRVSWKGILSSYMALTLNEELYLEIKEYISKTNSVIFQEILGVLAYMVRKLPSLRDYILLNGVGFQTNSVDTRINQYLGRLAFKEEAAGKLRVFAMVDVITQSLLEPLHKKLFDFFRLLPNDGTHDQELAFNKAQALALKYGVSFGFDLTAATDRLPLSSQISALNGIFGSNLGDTWAKILVNRDYVVPENDYKIKPGIIRYSVGQPMGALSSWAMLNLVHHLMVQFCWKTLNPTFKGWYADYVVLGDDIVIFDKEVASRYLQLCKHLGVTINENKSIISNLPVVEFAKRTSFKGFDVSALSFKEFITNNNFFGRLSIATKLVRRSYGKNNKKLFILSQIDNKTTRKMDLTHAIIGYMTQLVSIDQMKWSDLVALFNFLGAPDAYFGKKTDSVNHEALMSIFDSLLKKSEWSIEDLIDKRGLHFADKKLQAYKLSVMSRCQSLYIEVKHSKYIDNCLKEALMTILPVNESGDELLYPLYEYEKPRYYRLLSYFLPVDRVGQDSFDSRGGTMDNWEKLMFRDNFKMVTLESLLKLHLDLLSYKRDINFFQEPKDLREKPIDNPLKILDFIDETEKKDSKASFLNMKVDRQDMKPFAWITNEPQVIDTRDHETLVKEILDEGVNRFVEATRKPEVPVFTSKTLLHTYLPIHSCNLEDSDIEFSKSFEQFESKVDSVHSNIRKGDALNERMTPYEKDLVSNIRTIFEDKIPITEPPLKVNILNRIQPSKRDLVSELQSLIDSGEYFKGDIIEEEDEDDLRAEESNILLEIAIVERRVEFERIKLRSLNSNKSLFPINFFNQNYPASTKSISKSDSVASFKLIPNLRNNLIKFVVSWLITFFLLHKLDNLFVSRSSLEQYEPEVVYVFDWSLLIGWLLIFLSIFLFFGIWAWYIGLVPNSLEYDPRKTLIKDFAESTKELSSDNALLHMQVMDLKDKLSELSISNTSLIDSFKSLTDKFEDVELSRSRLEAFSSYLSGKLESIKSTLIVIRQENLDLNKQLSIKFSEFDRTSTLLDSTQKELALVTDRLDQILFFFDSTDHGIGNYINDVNSLFLECPVLELLNKVGQFTDLDVSAAKMITSQLANGDEVLVFACNDVTANLFKGLSVITDFLIDHPTVTHISELCNYW